MSSKFKVMSLRDAGVSLIDCVHKTPAEVSGSTYKYIAIPQMKDCRIDDRDARQISADDFKEWTKRALPQKNDVILSRRCNPGETAFVPEGVTWALGQNLVLLRSNGTVVYPPYLRWMVRSEEWWEQVRKFLNVGAIFDSLKCADVPNFQLSIPNLETQKKIVFALDSFENKIELNNQINETLESMAKAIFKEWFIDFGPVKAKAEGKEPFGMDNETASLFPNTFENSILGPIPKGWEVKTFGDISNCFDSKRVPLSGAEREKRKGIYPYYGAASQMGNIDDFLFDGIYVLMGEDGSVVNDDGSPVLQYVWGKFWVNNHAHVLTGKDITNEHLLLFLKHTIISPYVTGAVQPKLNQGNMNRIPFLKAPESINSSFAKIIEPLFQKIRENIDENRKLIETRDLLLPKLISGEIELKEIDV